MSEAHHDVLASGKGVMSTSSHPASPSACKQSPLKPQPTSKVEPGTVRLQIRSRSCLCSTLQAMRCYRGGHRVMRCAQTHWLHHARKSGSVWLRDLELHPPSVPSFR